MPTGDFEQALPETFFKHFRIGMFRTAPNGQVLYADETLARTLHYPNVETLLQRNSADIWLMNDMRAMFLQTLLRDREIHNQQLAMRCYDGCVIWGEISARAIYDTNGALLYFEGGVQEISSQKQVEERMLEIAKGVSTLAQTGEDFFKTLVTHLAPALDAAYVMIAERTDESEDQMRSICVYARGRIFRNFDFSARGTPGERALQEGSYYCSENVKQAFPDDTVLQRLNVEGFAGTGLLDSTGRPMGTMSVLFLHPIENMALVESMLKIFASRVSNELERRQMTTRLEASEKRFRALIENSEDGLTVINADGKIIYTSASSFKIIGHTVDHHLGERVANFIAPEDQQAASELFEEVLLIPGLRVPFRLRSVYPDGVYHWIEGSIMNLLYDPAVKGIILNYRDVTERVLAQERLRESEERFRMMAENIQDGLSIIQAGKVVFANRRLAEITGRDLPEIYQMSGFQFAAPEEHERLRAALFAAREGNNPKELSYWVVKKDGSRRYIQNRYSSLTPNSSGSDRYIITTDITERKLAEEELRFRADYERLIIEISTRLINVRPDQTNAALNDAMRLIGEFTGVDRCHIYLFSKDLDRMSCIAGWNSPNVISPNAFELQDLPAQASSWWFQKIHAQEVFFFSSRKEIPEQDTFMREMSEWLGEKSTLDAPIFSAGRPIGFLSVSSVREEHVWTKDEMVLQKLLAEIIANVLERRENEARSQQQMQYLEALHAIDRAITSKSEMLPVLEVLLQQVTRQLQIDAASVLLYDPVTKHLNFGNVCGFRNDFPTHIAYHLHHPILEKIVRERTMQSVNVPREWQSLWYEEGFISYLGIPLIARERIIGVLELYHRAPVNMDEDWLRFLQMLSEQAAIAIDSVTNFQNLSQAYEATLEGWAQALEFRHQETEGHSRRVVGWALRLGRAAGLHEDELVHLRRGALLHDIGKMGIPDRVLLKKGRLTKKEWEKMRHHPILAYDLLAPIPFLRPALDIPYAHHERWDGSGYPRGLKGEEIPLAARIFAVVDIWDALRENRTYRAAWPEEDVRAYLRKVAGKELDPCMVELFLHLLEEEDVTP